MDSLIAISILLGFGGLGLYLRHYLNNLKGDIQALVQSNKEYYNSKLGDVTDILDRHDLMIKSLDIKRLDNRYEHLNEALADIRSKITFLKVGESALAGIKSEIASLRIEIEVSRSMSSRRS